MMNGRENRNNGNQEKGKEEKETLSKVQYEVDRGRSMRPLSFFPAQIRNWDQGFKEGSSELL